MKLKKLIKEITQIQVKGSKEIEVSGVTSNSKLVAPGNVFVARAGQKENGAKYIPEAISAGAVAVVTDMYDPTLSEVVQLIHPHPEDIEATLSAEYYNNPSKELFVVGITGTCGKTTTSFLTKHVLDYLGENTGLIGSVEYIIGSHRYQANRTTPDVCTMHKLLRDMVNQGCSAAVMEVSSHALEQGRVEKVEFDVGVFTNLSQDHLDYHETMDAYFAAKKKLFKMCKKAIVNGDAPESAEILKVFSGAKLTYGIESDVDVKGSQIVYTSSGTRFQIEYQNQKADVLLPLIGKHNVYNALAATAIALQKGYPLQKIAEALALSPQVVGRLEAVPNRLGLKIYVDFAHKEDALRKVIESLKALNFRKVIVVFGCGGDRDRGKRPKMGAVCKELADFSIITNDNPRSENPQEIADQIASGFGDTNSYCIELDRTKAIAQAIEMATSDDAVLIAGRGHEHHQIFAHHTVELNDAREAAKICESLSRQDIHAKV